VDKLFWLGAILVVLTECGAATTAKEVEIKTPTLQCGYCEQTISTAVKKVEGVQAVSVDLEKKVVRVSYAEGATDVAKIESAISKAGYQANDSKADKTAYKSLPDCCKIEATSH
jgi:periplasmic mercuric ion binding protein